MRLPAEFPEALRRLVEAELAAGNAIVEISSTFPAPPVGACVKLAARVSTRPRASGDGLDFCDRGSSLYSGEFTDARRFFFVLEPPAPPPPEPDMDRIRAGTRAPAPPPVPSRTADAVARERAAPAAPASALERFRASMVIDYEKWHDGVGYDLDVIRGGSVEERAAIERLLLARPVSDWRDIEALAALGTAGAQAALRAALRSGDARVRAAVLDHAPELVSGDARAQSLIDAIERASLYDGLSQALDQIADFHPPEVVSALLRGTREREGEVACHLAAMLLFVHGQANEAFDWAHRPFFLRFNTEDRDARRAAFRALCARIGRDPDA